jgi:hypothetical protein
LYLNQSIPLHTCNIPTHTRYISKQSHRLYKVASSGAVDHGFEPRSVQPKDYTIGISSESGKYVRVGRHVYPQTGVSVSWQYKHPTKRVGLVQSGLHHHLIEY